MGGKIIQGNTPEQNRFVSISDFKWCMSWRRNILTPRDNTLEYMVGKDRLRDVITQVTVIGRTI